MSAAVCHQFGCTYQTVEVMHALNVDEKATPKLVGPLDVSVRQATPQALLVRDNACSVCHGG